MQLQLVSPRVACPASITNRSLLLIAFCVTQNSKLGARRLYNGDNYSESEKWYPFFLFVDDKTNIFCWIIILSIEFVCLKISLTDKLQQSQKQHFIRMPTLTLLHELHVTLIVCLQCHWPQSKSNSSNSSNNSFSCRSTFAYCRNIHHKLSVWSPQAISISGRWWW